MLKKNSYLDVRCKHTSYYLYVNNLLPTPTFSEMKQDYYRTLKKGMFEGWKKELHVE